MISEILGNDFMDYKKVQEICMNKGFSKYDVRNQKRLEGIKTVKIENDTSEEMWLWYDPRQIWKKYGS